MATPTNTQIWTEVIKLRSELQEQGKSLGDLTSDVGELRRRMDSYDQQASVNNALLKEVKGAIFFVRNSVRFFKWGAIIIIGSALTQIGPWVYHLFVR